MIEAQYLILLLGLAVAGHVMLLAFYRVVHPVVLVTMCFVVVSMLSASTLPGVVAWKYGRVYLALLAVVVGLFCIRRSQVGPALRALLAFAALYVLAGLWSEDPLGGLMFKGMFLFTVMMGAAAVLVARHEGEIWQWQRCMVLAGACVTLILCVGLAGRPGVLLSGERLAVFGLNPNRIAETLGPLLVFSCFGVLHEPSKLWRVAAYGMTLPAAALLLATGSRAGFGQAMIGFMLLMLPLVRRPALFLAGCGTIGLGMLFVLGFVEETRAVQISAYSFSTRTHVWSRALATFYEAPLFGIGWARMAGEHGWASSVNVLSIYLQVLVEMGIAGALAMAAMLVWWMRCARHAFIATAQHPTLRPLCYLAAALALSVLGHGVAESGALMGSSINAMCLGASAALMDALTVTAREADVFPLDAEEAGRVVTA